jgi:hypothetical protein
MQFIKISENINPPNLRLCNVKVGDIVTRMLA